MKKAIVLPLLLALSACADSPEESLAKARAEFAANDFAAARIHLASYLTAKPEDREAQLLQVRTLVALGDGHGAETAMAQLTGGKPPEGELAELAAEAALLRGVPDVALQLLGNRGGAEAERLRAVAALQKNDPRQAQTHFEASIEAGGNARAFADYARFHLMNGAIAEAEAMADRAAKAAPDGLDTLLVQGQLAVRRGDLARALGHYQRAGKIYPGSLAALLGQAAVLGDMGRTGEMQAVVDRAVAIAPRDRTVIFLQARAAAGRKDWAMVRATLQPVEAEIPQNDPLRLLYAEALIRLGQNELAIAQLGPLVRVMPGNRDAVLLLAEATLSGGDARGALALIKPLADHPAARREELDLAARAAKAAGDPGAAHYADKIKAPPVQAAGRDMIDGDAAMKSGNWAGAVEAYGRVLAVTDGRNYIALNNLAYAHLMLGNTAQALEASRKALNEAPGNASVIDTAGWVLFKSGKDPKEARRLLQRAAQLAPNNPTIRSHLAEAERAGK